MENYHKFAYDRGRTAIGCILVGGESSRMGSPKQLIQYNGKSWLDSLNSCLKEFCDEIVIVGKGDLPDGNWQRLPDAPGYIGPMAGVLAVINKYSAPIIVCACDMPDINKEALGWLFSQRRSEDWAIIPEINGRLQPLFAIYDQRIRPVLEDLRHRNIMKMQKICDDRHVRIVKPPLNLHKAWHNINEPQQLDDWSSRHK